MADPDARDDGDAMARTLYRTADRGQSKNAGNERSLTADMATQRRCATRKKPQTPDRLANQWFAQMHFGDNRPGNADSDTLHLNAKSNNISSKRINSQLTDLITNKKNLKIFLSSLLRILQNRFYSSKNLNLFNKNYKVRFSLFSALPS
jgi:hypothetical protein